jgi:hypothetical protein
MDFKKAYGLRNFDFARSECINARPENHTFQRPDNYSGCWTYFTWRDRNI